MSAATNRLRIVLWRNARPWYLFNVFVESPLKIHDGGIIPRCFEVYMKIRTYVLPLTSAILMAFGAPGYANEITGASGTVTCSSYSFQFTGINLTPSVTYSVHFSFTLTPASGAPITITGTAPIPPGTSGNFDVTSTGSLGPLTQAYTITSSSAALFSGTTQLNAIPIVFTSTAVMCGGGGGCPATIGFWKHHAFPGSVMTAGLVIGGVTYSPADLLEILNNPGHGNAVAILGPQLVAALLNKAAGAADNSTADAAITTAEALLSTNNLNLLNSIVAPSSSLGQALIAQAAILDGYNNGNFHTCSDAQGLTLGG